MSLFYLPLECICYQNFHQGLLLVPAFAVLVLAAAPVAALVTLSFRLPFQIG